MIPHIRMAEAVDAEILQDIARKAYTPYIAVMRQVPAPMVADFAAHIRSDTVFVSELDGVVGGYAIVLCTADEFWLDNIAVVPEWQGCGIGRTLITAVEDWLKRRTDRYQLYTNVKMAKNILLYRKLGFVETDRRVVDGFDRIYFEKRL